MHIQQIVSITYMTNADNFHVLQEFKKYIGKKDEDINLEEQNDALEFMITLLTILKNEDLSIHLS